MCCVYFAGLVTDVSEHCVSISAFSNSAASIRLEAAARKSHSVFSVQLVCGDAWAQSLF